MAKKDVSPNTFKLRGKRKDIIVKITQRHIDEAASGTDLLRRAVFDAVPEATDIVITSDYDVLIGYRDDGPTAH
jgi:hypothetical protein